LRPNIGFFVPRLDIKDLMQIFEARECIERFVFEGAFDKLTKEDIEMLKESVEKQKRFLHTEEIREYLKEDERFHLVFFNAFNNPYLTELVKSIRTKYLVCSKRIRLGSEVASTEHSRMIELIEKGEKEKAAQLMSEHVIGAKLRMMEGYISYNG
jgi:DNA-binding GntR family transcriptional regulator